MKNCETSLMISCFLEQYVVLEAPNCGLLGEVLASFRKSMRTGFDVCLHFESIVASMKDHFGIHFGVHFGVHFGIILESFWDPFGDHRGVQVGSRGGCLHMGSVD